MLIDISGLILLLFITGISPIRSMDFRSPGNPLWPPNCHPHPPQKFLSFCHHCVFQYINQWLLEKQSYKTLKLFFKLVYMKWNILFGKSYHSEFLTWFRAPPLICHLVLEIAALHLPSQHSRNFKIIKRKISTLIFLMLFGSPIKNIELIDLFNWSSQEHIYCRTSQKSNWIIKVIL